MKQTLNQSGCGATINRSACKADYSGFNYFVYTIIDEKNIYVGQTNNLERRFNDHSNKQVKSTKRFKKCRMFVVEKHIERGSALK